MAINQLKTRIRVHARKEWHLLKVCWRSLVLGVIAQYVHSVATNLVYYLYVRRPILKDLGFMMFGDVPDSWDWVSEVAFFSLLGGAIVYAFLPFFAKKPKFFFVHVLRRVLIVGGIGQCLRMSSFLVTILPSPAEHCQDPAQFNPPTTAVQILFRLDGITGCGDLIFSSHTLLATTMALTVTKYSPHLIAKVLAWMDTIFLGLMVVALRKHYSVDVVVAWYTVPMLFYLCERKFPDYIPDDLAAHIGMTKPQARAQNLSLVIPSVEVMEELQHGDAKVEMTDEELHGNQVPRLDQEPNPDQAPTQIEMV